jgi:LPS export ABC transporter permease LptF/LPS export ABC transporter permease LptG
VGLLSRYILRLIAPGVFLGTGVFLFALLLNELIVNIELIVTQGANPSTVGLAFAQLIPALLAVAVPSALLLGILLALNRLSSGHELIAMRAGGVSPWRLLMPIGTAAAAAFGVCLLLMLEIVPPANQRFVELRDELLNSRLRTEIEPRMFYDELLDGRVLLVGDARPGEDGWRRVFLADTARADEPTIFVADRGRLVTVPEERLAFFELTGVEVHNAGLDDPGLYRIQRAERIRLPLDAEEVFGPERLSPSRSARAMLLPDLLNAYEGTDHPIYLVEIHKKFAFPFACLAFGLLGLGLGIRPSPGPARAGSFALAILVILAWYAPIMFGEQLAAAGELPPWIAMWGANIATVAAGIALLALASRELHPLEAARRVLSRLWLLVPRLRSTVRRWRLPGLPTILDRYVVARYGTFLAIALAALLSWELIGLLNVVIGDAFEREIPTSTVFRYLGLSVPAFTAQMLPLATLTATLVTFGLLSRHNEVTAFLSGGVSRTRLVVPALAAGLLVTGAGFGLQERLIPLTAPEAEDIGARIRGQARRTVNPLERHWGMGPGGQIFHYDEYDAENAVLSGLSVFRLSPDGASLSGRSYAASAHWSDAEGTWTGIGGWERDLDQGRAAQPFAVREIPDVSVPEALVEQDLATDHLPFRELEERIRRIEAAGHHDPVLHVALETKAALPFASLVTILIGLPFAFRRTNQSAWASAAIAFAIAIVYLVATQFFRSIGNAELLDPVLAAWSPNLFFGLASVFLLLQRR